MHSTKFKFLETIIIECGFYVISCEVHDFMFGPIREPIRISIPKLELEFDLQLDSKLE
jgi:hypothetical protein